MAGKRDAMSLLRPIHLSNPSTAIGWRHFDGSTLGRTPQERQTRTDDPLL